MISRLASEFAPLPTGVSIVAVCALVVATAAPASAQFGQAPGRGTIGGGVDGNLGGGDTVGGRNTGGTAGRGGARGGTGSAVGDGLRSADEIFSDGVAREGAPEERQIGAANGAAGNARRGMGAGRIGGMGGFGGLGGFGGMGGFGGFNQLGGNQFGGQAQQSRSVRTRLTSGVDTLPPPPRAVGATVNNRLSSLPSNGRFTGVDVRMEGRTAILLGRVATEEDKRMARLMVRLEPGVSRVENRLEVAAAH